MPKAKGHASLGGPGEDEEDLAPLEEDVGIMDDDNEDVAHEELEEETDGVVVQIDAETADQLFSFTSRHCKEALFIIKKVIGFSSVLCKSDQKTSALLQCCEHEKLKPQKPIKVVATCWNSHIAALDRHWANHAAITCLCSATIYEHLKLKKYALRQQEWVILEQLCPLLHVHHPHLRTQLLY